MADLKATLTRRSQLTLGKRPWSFHTVHSPVPQSHSCPVTLGVPSQVGQCLASTAAPHPLVSLCSCCSIYSEHPSSLLPANSLFLISYSAQAAPPQSGDKLLLLTLGP